MIEEEVKKEVKLLVAADHGAIWNSIQRQVKRGAIQQIMHECRNNQSAAAKALGINRASLKTYIKQVFTKSEMATMGIES